MAKRKINWLLLRGLTREKSHWGSFLPLLKKNFPGSQVFCLDLPGVGTENNRPSPLSIAGITDDVRGRWRKTFSKSKIGDWVCVGHSLGGMIALDWQERYSKDFVGAVLMNTSSRGVAPPWKRVNFGAITEFARIALSKDLESHEQRVLSLTSNLQSKNKKLLAEWVEFAKARPLYPMTSVRQIGAAALFKARVPSRVPLLFLYSKADRLAHYSCSQQMAKLYGMETAEHKKAGHDLALDDPDWVLENLIQFSERFK